ncbi:hypothetical protein BGZ65_007660, partial [Modicella reniformis]
MFDVFGPSLSEEMVQVIVKLPSPGPSTVAKGKRKAEEYSENGIQKKCKTLGDLLFNRKLSLPDQQPQRHAFREREEFFKTVIPSVIDNYTNRGDRDHKSHSFFLVPGGSGIGKTRAAYELNNLVPHARNLGIKLSDDLQAALQDPCYLKINFNNQHFYRKELDSNTYAVRIGVRLAAAAWSKDPEVIITAALENDSLEEVYAKNVIQRIYESRIKTTGRTLEAFIIHIDEYQNYINDAQRYGISRNDACADFRHMLKAIGQVMADDNRFFIIPICTGTSAIDIRFLPSDYTGLLVTLPPLTHESAIQMFRDIYKGHPLSAEVERQHHFRIALKDTCYIPRFIDFLLTSPTKFQGLSRDIDWGNLLCDAVRKKYPHIGMQDFWGSQDDVRVMISLALLRMQVTRRFVLPSGKELGELERDGLVYLLAVDGSRQDIVVVMIPFVTLKILNQGVGLPVIPDHLLFFPTIDNSWKWQDFEGLLGHFQKAIIDALITIRLSERGRATEIGKAIAGEDVPLEQESWRLCEIFRGARGSSTLLDRQVRLKSLGVYQEKKKCIVEKTDILPLTSVISCKCGEHDLSKGIFHCTTGNANLDYRWTLESLEGKTLAIFLEAKHTSTDRVLYQVELQQFYDGIINSTHNHREEYDVVVVIFTNRRIAGHDILDKEKMPNLLLIDQSCIDQYLSPSFAHRGLLT